MEHFQTKLMPISQQDLAVWDVVKQSFPQTLSLPVAILSLILNIILPGFGTFVLASQTEPLSRTMLSMGCLQFMTAPFLVGYIWAIYWSVLAIQKARGQNIGGGAMYNQQYDDGFTDN